MSSPSIKPVDAARRAARQFDLPGPIHIGDFPDKGNIHGQTYLVTAGAAGHSGEFLLQRLNTDVCTRPDITMRTLIACIEAQRKALSEGALPESERWEPIRLIPTREGAAYLKIEDPGGEQYWRMMVRIPHARSYKSLAHIPDPDMRIRIAEEAGRGLALFGVLTAGMDAAAVPDPLPGYRNTALYYDQLASVLSGSRTCEEAAPFLPGDPLLRQDCSRHFLVHLGPDEYRRRMEERPVRELVAVALEQKRRCLRLQEGLASGRLKTAVVHGDTKLDNFLFSIRSARAVSLVDLDTVMAHTWLSDWGDMARSVINIRGEKVRNPDELEISMDVFKALARGFIRAGAPLPRHEAAMMADAAGIMALELGVRFLTDYVRGDTYFRLGENESPDLNRARAAVQFAVFRLLLERREEARQHIDDLCARFRTKGP